MTQRVLLAIVFAVALVSVILIASSIRVVWQYERGVHFRLGRIVAVREPGLRLIIPVIDRLWPVSMRIVTMPIQSQGIITRDNVSLVELKDIQLPDSMKRAMAREAEAEREKRAKIIAAEGEARAAAALGEASDTMMKHPLALQLRNLQTLAELGVEKNTTVIFPAPLMSAIGELTGFLTRESAATALQPNGFAGEALTRSAQR